MKGASKQSVLYVLPIFKGSFFSCFQSVGCDGKLSSSAKFDKCRVCGGDGTTCHTTVGVIDTENLKNGKKKLQVSSCVQDRVQRYFDDLDL